MARLRRSRLSLSALLLRWLAAAVIVAIAVAYIQPLRSYHRARGRVDERKAEVAELARTNALVARKLARAGTDEFLEREARKLGLVRAGERLFIMKGVEERRAPGIR